MSLKMKSFAVALCMGLAVTPAFAADYDATEKSPLYEIHLHVPATAMKVAALKEKILALYKADADLAKSDAKDDQEGNPSFQPYQVDMTWRVTFENDAMLSLSAETTADTGAAHPGDTFQTLVWDKKADQAVTIDALFPPEQAKAAMSAISDAAIKAWTKIYIQRSDQKPEAYVAKSGIGADPEKLKTYALTYAKGETTANGIVLLYGSGQVWPNVLGDFRLAVPVSAFAKYLKPQWKAVFNAG